MLFKIKYRVKPLLASSLVCLLTGGALLLSFSGTNKLFGDTLMPRPWLKSSEHSRLQGAEDFKVQKPAKLSFQHPAMSITLYARSFSPGEAVYIEIIPENNESIEGYRFFFLKQKILLSQHKWGYRGFFALSPYLNDKIKKKKKFNLKVLPPKHINQKKHQYPLTLHKAGFVSSRSTLDVGKYARIKKSPAEVRQIKAGRKKKKNAYAASGSNMITNKLSHPRDFHYITSPFWAKRVYARYKEKNGKKIQLKPRVSIHRGLDFRAPEGAPIFAIATGRVVLAEKLYYEGNCVIIHHGNSIFSVYSHMSKLKVYKNQYVRAGKLLGLAGKTGQVTGAHLHLALYINKIPVDPQGFLSLPVRDK